MYYATVKGSQIYIHDAASGAPHFTISVRDNMTNYMVNGNILTIAYNDGAVEVYDLKNRSRIR